MLSQKEIHTRLKDFSIFKEFDDAGISGIAASMNQRAFKAGEYIMKEGDQGDEMFVLLTGSVRVIKNTKQGEQYTIVDLKAAFNVFFGEMALMDNDERSASIAVLEDCITLVMNQESFAKLGEIHPEIAFPITRTISKIIIGRLRNMNNDVILLFDALVNEIESSQL